MTCDFDDEEVRSADSKNFFRELSPTYLEKMYTKAMLEQKVFNEKKLDFNHLHDVCFEQEAATGLTDTLYGNFLEKRILDIEHVID